MTPLQKLNYKYAALRWRVTGSLSIAVHTLNCWGYPSTADKIKGMKKDILIMIKHQYEHDKKFLRNQITEANLTNIETGT